jgi:hypothetical protein
MLANSNVRFYISQHEDTEEYRETLKQSFLRFKHFNIQYKSVGFFDRWHKKFDTDSDGVPMPYNSNPQKAFNACRTAKQCVRVEGDYMYRCSHLADAFLSLDTGTVGPEWNRVKMHKRVTFESTPEEILRYLRSGPGAECSMCRGERGEFVPFRQYTMEEIQHIKELVRQRNRKAG